MTTTTSISELTGDFVVDTAHTRIGFVARHPMATKVSGQFDRFDGRAHLDGDAPSRSSAQLTIQAESIQTRNPQRDNHLRRHFLDVGGHPTITFTSTKVEQVAQASYRLTGDLTIRGVSKSVTVPLELTLAESDPRNTRVALAGEVTIHRKDWGVSWNAVMDLLVSDQVTLELDVAAVRRSSRS